ncbi:MAG TPA: hypothetical protein VK985_05345 [Rariglobus sp.]|nr:hypothetical protein [Rariglobus sp.]
MKHRFPLIASLAINVALVLFVILQRTPSDHSATNIPPQSDSRKTSSSTGKISEESRAIAAALQRPDLQSLRDELLAAGVPEDTVGFFVENLIVRRYRARIKALQPDTSDTWWKTPATFTTQADTQKAEAIYLEMKEEMRRLRGPEPVNGRDYGFLPKEKREALQKLENDYRDLSQKLARESLEFRIDQDVDKAGFIDAERRRDLASLLTPAELYEYDLRTSSTAQRLRSRMTEMNASEDEYRAIFALQKSFDDRYVIDRLDSSGNLLPSGTPAPTPKEAQKQLQAQLEAALGQERYQDYILSNDQEYLALQAAAKRFDLPAGIPKKLFYLETGVPATAARIADDQTLTLEQKKQALVQLGKANRNKLYSLVGTETGNAILAGHRLNWIDSLESGFIPTINENDQKGIRRLGQPANAGSR